MERIKINLKEISQKEIGLIVNFLNQGKVIIYPTDTIYGLGCRATDRRAIRMIFKIKKREKRKPLLVLVDSLKAVKKYCYVNKKQESCLREVWYYKKVVNAHVRSLRARPVSVILKSRGILPKELMGGGDSLAMRLLKNDFLIKIIKRIKAPLVSTSANISGRKSLFSVKNIGKYFKKDKPDLVVDGGALKGKPSVVIDLRNVEDIKIIRK